MLNCCSSVSSKNGFKFTVPPRSRVRILPPLKVSCCSSVSTVPAGRSTKPPSVREIRVPAGFMDNCCSSVLSINPARLTVLPLSILRLLPARVRFWLSLPVLFNPLKSTVTPVSERVRLKIFVPGSKLRSVSSFLSSKSPSALMWLPIAVVLATISLLFCAILLALTLMLVVLARISPKTVSPTFMGSAVVPAPVMVVWSAWVAPSSFLFSHTTLPAASVVNSWSKAPGSMSSGLIVPSIISKVPTAASCISSFPTVLSCSSEEPTELGANCLSPMVAVAISAPKTVSFTMFIPVICPTCRS